MIKAEQNYSRIDYIQSRELIVNRLSNGFNKKNDSVWFNMLVNRCGWISKIVRNIIDKQ